MRMYDIIKKKRDGNPLLKEEIDYLIRHYVEGKVPDYQLSALLMAIYFQNMTDEECALLTMAMANSGDQIDLSSIKGVKVDKHSTGGVGDKITLVVAPLVASVGVPVAKMSGRGLGHTGGTIDKLESIPGFRSEMSNDEFIKLVNENDLAITGQTGNLTPADKKIYSIRDVTATVDSLPLIASSIMSKKIASGADAIVLDIKVGDGAFMKHTAEAKKLADLMINIGNQVGKSTVAIISDMNEPLGFAVGNALEVEEAILTLKGQGPQDVTDLSLTIASHMVVLGKKAANIEEAKETLEENLHNGKALESFKTLITSQGGDSAIIDDPNLLPQADYKVQVTAHKSGWIQKIEANAIGQAALLLGAGRTNKESPIDLAVGIKLHKKVGDPIEEGELLLTVHSNNFANEHIINKLQTHIHISNEQVDKLPLIHDILIDS